MKIAEPESSFAEFDIFIPEDTVPGAYQLGFLTGVHEDPNGGRIVNTYAQSFTDDIALTLTGCTITVEAAKLRGDVDRDGILAVNDAVLLQRYVTEDLTAEEAAALDVEDLDGDEELTVSDVCWILETLSNEKG